MSEVEKKRTFNKLKHDLEPWRNLIVHLDSVLTWEKKFYPAAIFSAISFFFMALWALDLSTVTMMALFGLFLVCADFVSPSLSRFLYSPDNWNGSQEVQFERVVNALCAIKIMLSAWYEYIFTAKERKSTMFVIVMSISLLVMAWIGTLINNLLLVYLMTLGALMYPGIQERGVFNLIKEKFGCVVNSKIQQLRDKTKKSD